MNILHLLSQNHLTGSEVYASTLVEQQLNHQHHVFQASNAYFFPTKAVKFELEVETKSRFTFLKNILWLRNFIRKQNIHIIHTHSRAAAKLAFWATIFTKTAQVSTVHGVQHSSLSKKLINQYGQFIIAVCENVKLQLMHDFSYSEKRIQIIPNPVDSKIYNYVNKTKSSEIKKIGIVGRTTGPKGLRTQQVLECLFSSNTPSEKIKIDLLGGSLNQLNLADNIKANITEISKCNLNSEIYSQYDLIIGSGRVCMEALVSGTPCIAFGEACYVGLITEQNLEEAFKSNFGDIHPDSKKPQLDTDLFKNDLVFSLNKSESGLSLAEKATELFSTHKIYLKIQRLYESAYFLKNYSKWIPILMYHKIPDEKINSSHKIYVTKSNFEKHLRFFKNRGFVTLTFSELEAFRTAKKDFKLFPKKPLILTFDDGYLDNLTNAAPLLKKYDFSAQLFLLANQQINQNSWDLNSNEPAHEIIANENRKKWASTPFEIGSHGFLHKKITDLTLTESKAELKESKKTLENEFQKKINVYAFTYGLTNKNAAESAAEAGYSYAVNTDSGGLLLEEEPFSIFRVNIFPEENWWSLYKKTSTWYRKYYFIKRKK